MTVNDVSRAVSEWHHNLERRLQTSITLLEPSIMLLDNIYSIGITHEDCHMMFIVQATGEYRSTKWRSARKRIKEDKDLLLQMKSNGKSLEKKWRF